MSLTIGRKSWAVAGLLITSVVMPTTSRMTKFITVGSCWANPLNSFPIHLDRPDIWRYKQNRTYVRTAKWLWLILRNNMAIQAVVHTLEHAWHLAIQAEVHTLEQNGHLAIQAVVHTLEQAGHRAIQTVVYTLEQAWHNFMAIQAVVYTLEQARHLAIQAMVQTFEQARHLAIQAETYIRQNSHIVVVEIAQQYGHTDYVIVLKFCYRSTWTGATSGDTCNSALIV